MGKKKNQKKKIRTKLQNNISGKLSLEDEIKNK